MKISVDEPKCYGASQCVLIAPDVSDQRDEDGIVVLLDADPPAARYPAMREAAQVCPAAAILIEES